MFRSGQLALVVALGLTLAACQSSGTQQVLEEVAAGERIATETLGDGETTLALLLPRSAGGEAGRHARDIRDAAALALEDLGAGKISIQVHDTGPGVDGVLGFQQQLAGAKLILGPMGSPAISALKTIPGRPSALAFGGNGGPHGDGVFALETDAVESAQEAARVSAMAGHRSFAAIVPDGFPQADRSRLSRGLNDAGVKSLEFITYSQNGLAAELAAKRDQLLKFDSLMIFGEGSTPAAIASVLRKSDSLGPNAVLIGNLGWAGANFSRSELEGALVALPDQSSPTLVADRYRQKTGRPLSSQAAYGYDAVAVAAGIVRTLGPDALSQATLTKPSGFLGTTGPFRFLADGSVQRQLAIYQVRDKSLQLLDPVQEGF